MWYYTISPLINGVILALLGIFVFSRNKYSLLNITYGLFCLAISFWSFSYLFWQLSKSRESALFWCQLLMTGATFIPATYFHFITTLTGDYKKVNIKKVIYFVYGIAFIFTPLNFTSSMIKDIVPQMEFLFWPAAGPVFKYFLLYFATFSIYACYFLLKEIKNSSGIRKNQAIYIFIGSALGYIGGATNFPLWYGIKIYPAGNILIALYVSLVGYSIVKYRLMDITVAITRTGVFVAVYTLVLGIPFAVAYFLRLWLIGIFDINWWAIPLAIMAVLATVGPFIYIYFERKAEDRLLKEQKRYQNTLRQASIGMTRIRSLRKLLDLIAHIITKTVRISFAAVYLFHEADDEYVLQVCRVKKKTLAHKLSARCALIEWIKNNQTPLLYEEIKRKMINEKDTGYRKIEEEMRGLGASVILPSLLENKLLGLLVLGSKLSGRIFTPEDLSVFQVLASQAALAIENAQFYEDAKEMQSQIAQAEKMATIGTMADGLSHQINNRFYALSLIAGDTIDTIKMTDASNCSPEIKDMLGQINHALERIQFNVLQGGEVVKGILKYTRKGDEGFEALTMDQVIDGTLAMVQYKVKLADFDLIREYPVDLVKLKGNLVQLEEVFFNFIDNAYDAIVERRSTLKEEGYRGKIIIRAQEQDAIMRIEIQDNGMGVKEENAKKLFTPFFTTKVSSRRGTGLGLYVINKIITETHKGKIFIESQHTVGTKFIVELPIAA